MLTNFQINVTQLFTEYSYECLLGEGCFGKIYKLVKKDTKEVFAVKKVYIDPKYHNRELDNFYALKDSPGILKLVHYAEETLDNLTIFLDQFSEKKGNGFIEQERDSLWRISKNYTKVLYILTKAYDNNLRSYILSKKLDRRAFKLISLQLLKGLHEMHRKGVAHRDLKPDNILINEKSFEVVIADLGSAKQIGLNKGGIAYICSRAYRAPELLMGSTIYGTRIDLWSLGCILFEMMNETGSRFFRGKNGKEMLREILKVIGEFNNQDLKGMNVKKKVTIESKIHMIDVTKLVRSCFTKEDIDFGLGFLKWNPNDRKEAGSLINSKYFEDVQG